MLAEGTEQVKAQLQAVGGHQKYLWAALSRHLPCDGKSLELQD